MYGFIRRITFVSKTGQIGRYTIETQILNSKKMKKINVLIGCMFAFISSQAQQVTGSWSGSMDLHGKDISVVFHVTHQNQKLSATMDSPSQNVFGFSTTSTELKDSILTIRMDEANMQYQGRIMKNGSMNGIFTQMGKKYLLNLTQNGKLPIAKVTKSEKDRMKPYAYSYCIDTVSINSNFRAMLSEPIKSGKTAAIIIDCKVSTENDFSENSTLSKLIDHLSSKGFTVVCSIDNNCDTNAAVAYLKTLNKVNQKKIAVLTETLNEMVATFGSNSKTISLDKRVNVVGSEPAVFNQLTNWLLRVV